MTIHSMHMEEEKKIENRILFDREKNLCVRPINTNICSVHVHCLIPKGFKEYWCESNLASLYWTILGTKVLNLFLKLKVNHLKLLIKKIFSCNFQVLCCMKFKF